MRDHSIVLGVTIASLGLTAAGCPKAPPPVLPPEAEVSTEPAPALRGLTVAARRGIEGLEAVECAAAGCTWHGPDGAHAFDPLTLVPGEASPDSTPIEAGPWPEPPTDEPSQRRSWERLQWATLMESWRRLPFQRQIPVAGGAMVTYQRGLEGTGGKLLRIGGGFRSVDAPGLQGSVSSEGWLAPHPSGLELYLLLWPEAELHAYDSRSMLPRWSLELPGPSQGLFVDPAGRYALLSLTAAADPDRLTDHPPPPLAASPEAELLRGSFALPSDPPELLGVLLVDLASRAVVARAEGAFRGWIATPDGAWLLASEREILRLEVRD